MSIDAKWCFVIGRPCLDPGDWATWVQGLGTWIAGFATCAAVVAAVWAIVYARKGVQEASKGVIAAEKAATAAVDGVDEAKKAVLAAERAANAAELGVTAAQRGVELAVEGLEVAKRAVETAADGVDVARDGTRIARDQLDIERDRWEKDQARCVAAFIAKSETKASLQVINSSESPIFDVTITVTAHHPEQVAFYFEENGVDTAFSLSGLEMYVRPHVKPFDVLPPNPAAIEAIAHLTVQQPSSDGKPRPGDVSWHLDPAATFTAEERARIAQARWWEFDIPTLQDDGPGIPPRRRNASDVEDFLKGPHGHDAIVSWLNAVMSADGRTPSFGVWKDAVRNSWIAEISFTDFRGRRWRRLGISDVEPLSPATGTGPSGVGQP